MNKVLIAIDVDGTLIDDHLRLSSRSEKILSHLASEGALIVLASGRPWRSVSPYYARLGCHGPVIVYNGAHVYNPENLTFAPLKRSFNQNDIQDIAIKMGKKITSFMAEGEKGIYLKREDNYLNHYFPYLNLPYQIGPIESILKENPYTAIFKTQHRYDDELASLVESHAGLCFRHWRRSLYSEAHLKDVDKGSALRYLMRKLNYSKDEIYAFGDSDNDREMLLEAGHPFAMKGAKSEMLTRDFPLTLADNNHDGVALTLASLFAK